VRIHLLTDWTAYPGGSEPYATLLVRLLRDAGHEVRFVASGAAVPDDAGVDVRAFGSTSRAAQSLLQVANLPAAARVRAIVREWDPDLAIVPQFAYHLSPAIFRALGRVPAIVFAMDYKFVCPLGTKLLPAGSLCVDSPGLVCVRRGCTGVLHWLRDRPRYRGIAAAWRGAARLVACSRSVQQALAAEGIDADCVPLPVPPPGASYRRAPAPAPLLVYAGRLAREKGVDVLLRACALAARDVATLSLRVIGEGPERASLESLAASLPLGRAVTFTGALTPAAVEGELASAWALVAPSRWAEPFGLVAVEAIVRGVPVVASAHGGLADSVEDGVSGLLVPNGNVDALARALVAVGSRAAFPGLCVPTSASRRLQQRHDPDAHVRRLLSGVRGRQ
jgi:glycosyltransferase involved in cell wall biosynthesis